MRPYARGLVGAHPPRAARLEVAVDGRPAFRVVGGSGGRFRRADGEEVEDHIMGLRWWKKRVSRRMGSDWSALESRVETRFFTHHSRHKHKELVRR